MSATKNSGASGYAGRMGPIPARLGGARPVCPSCVQGQIEVAYAVATRNGLRAVEHNRRALRREIKVVGRTECSRELRMTYVFDKAG